LEACLIWIDKHTKKILENKQWEKMSKELLITIIKRDTLGVSKEIDIFDGVIRWGRAHAESKKPEDLKVALKDVIKHIRFPLLTSGDLASKVVPSGVLEASQIFYPCLPI